eukprot:scaffold68194_cov58-Attheya_sp.AAC.8
MNQATLSEFTRNQIVHTLDDNSSITFTDLSFDPAQAIPIQPDSQETRLEEFVSQEMIVISTDNDQVEEEADLEFAMTPSAPTLPLPLPDQKKIKKKKWKLSRKRKHSKSLIQSTPEAADVPNRPLLRLTRPLLHLTRPLRLQQADEATTIAVMPQCPEAEESIAVSPATAATHILNGSAAACTPPETQREAVNLEIMAETGHGAEASQSQAAQGTVTSLDQRIGMTVSGTSQISQVSTQTQDAFPNDDYVDSLQDYPAAEWEDPFLINMDLIENGNAVRH